MVPQSPWLSKLSENIGDNPPTERSGEDKGKDSGHARLQGKNERDGTDEHADKAEEKQARKPVGVKRSFAREEMVHLNRRNTAKESAGNRRKPAGHCRAGRIWRI